MSRDPNAPPYYSYRFERVYKPRRDSMTAAEARRWKRDEEAERLGREAVEDTPSSTPSENARE